MSLPTWTLDALLSSSVSHQGECWRIVEAQNKVSTTKLSDNLQSQQVLEDQIESTKPTMPPACFRLNFLLAAPFRYSPYPRGSRFRRANQSEGAFYASESVETAAAETAFYRLLFFIELPGTPWPSNAAELTAFSVDVHASRLLDLQWPPFSTYANDWTDLTRYETCQAFADLARSANIQVLRYRSVRDPAHGSNLALLSPEAFASTQPRQRQTWRVVLSQSGVRLICEFPAKALEFDRAAFAADPRIAAFDWKRG